MHGTDTVDRDLLVLFGLFCYFSVFFSVVPWKKLNSTIFGLFSLAPSENFCAGALATTLKIYKNILLKPRKLNFSVL